MNDTPRPKSCSERALANHLYENEKKAPEWDLQEVRRIILKGLQGLPARVYLFGSRAVGNSSHYSDIDVGILPRKPMPVGTLAEIREALEDSNVLYSVDIVDLSETSADFRERVMREGRSMGRSKERLTVARRALTTLSELCALPSPSKIERDAAIQRFEYTFEATWKAGRQYLKDVEGLEAASPKAVVRASLRAGVLDETKARQAWRWWTIVI